MMIPGQKRRNIDTSKDTQFNDAWIVLAIVITLIGLVTGSAFLTTVAVTLLVIAGLSWLWAAASLWNLTYHRAFSERRAFQGETVELTLEVRNAKPLPQPWVTIRDLFPPELPVATVALDVNPSSNLAEFNTFWMLGPYQRVTRRFTIGCTTRGFHRFGPADMTTGDAFGFFNRDRRLENEETLIVYPRLYPVAELGLPTKNPFGAQRAARSLYEDPLRPAGIREWQPSDSMRRVHWKATARAQELLSRVYEPSEEQVIQIFLNVATLERHWHGYIPELHERAISVAGSLAAVAAEERLPVGLLANGALPGSDQPLRLFPGRSPNQLLHILEMLAAVTPFATQPVESLLVDHAPRLPWGATLVMVTAVTHDALLATLSSLAAAGRRVVLFSLAEAPPQAHLPKVTVYHLPHLVADLVAPARIQPDGAGPASAQATPKYPSKAEAQC